MIEILRTNDAVTLSFVEAVLNDEEIDHFVADRHISMIEGSIGAFPRRVLVPRDLRDRACRVLREAGLAHMLSEGQA